MSDDRKKYPYPPFKPRKEIELINFLVEVLYPKPETPAHRNELKNKIRQKIRYWQGQSKLLKNYTTAEFFTWACEVWSELPSKAQGFPRKCIGGMNQTWRFMPEIPEDCREGYLSLWQENQMLQSDLKAANAEVARLKRELVNAKNGKRT